jgi:hypothetical protein
MLCDPIGRSMHGAFDFDRMDSRRARFLDRFADVVA